MILFVLEFLDIFMVGYFGLEFDLADQAYKSSCIYLFSMEYLLSYVLYQIYDYCTCYTSNMKPGYMYVKSVPNIKTCTIFMVLGKDGQTRRGRFQVRFTTSCVCSAYLECYGMVFEDSIVTPKCTHFTGVLACLIPQVKTQSKIADRVQDSHEEQEF